MMNYVIIYRRNDSVFHKNVETNNINNYIENDSDIEGNVKIYLQNHETGYCLAVVAVNMSEAIKLVQSAEDYTGQLYNPKKFLQEQKIKTG